MFPMHMHGVYRQQSDINSSIIPARTSLENFARLIIKSKYFTLSVKNT